MKTLKQPDSSKLRAEYTLADFPGDMTRGRYVRRAAAGSNIVVIDADLVSAFPDSAAVNKALRTLLESARCIAAGAN